MFDDVITDQSATEPQLKRATSLCHLRNYRTEFHQIQYDDKRHPVCMYYFRDKFSNVTEPEVKIFRFAHRHYM